MAYYQQDMLSIRSRTLLANILAEVVLLSQAIEQYREALAQIAFFDCIALFRFLDREEKGYLREKDFQRVVGTSHRKLLTYAFSWFDNMKVGEISRLQFAVFLLPKDDLTLRQLVAERVQNPEISYAQHETILQQFDIFRRMLLEIMNREMKIVQLRRELVASQDYSTKAALVAIDGNNHRWANSQDLFKFLKNFGFDVSLRQVEKLMQAINYNLDGKISEQQLAWVVEGFQSKNKSYLTKIKASNKKEEQPPIKTEEEEQVKSSPSKLKEEPVSTIERFQIIKEKMRLAEEAEKRADEELIRCDLIFVQENKKFCELKLQEIHRKKQMELIQAQELQREKILIEEYRANQIQEQLLRENELLREKERLIKLEKRLQMTLKEATFKPTSPALHNKRLYSFAQESPKTDYLSKGFEIIDAHLPRKDYQNLTNLNSLSIVESYRRASQVSDTHYQQQLSESTAHFNSQELKQRIKQEMEAEKAIQERFSRGDYNTSRFANRASPTLNPNASPQPSASKVTERYEPASFQSPQRVPNFKKTTNKFTVSTGNKLSEQKN